MKKLTIYLFSIFVLTLLSLGVWMLILFNFDPESSDIVTISTFFASLFIFLTGILSLILFYLKIKISNNEVIFANLVPSIRQSVLISAIVVSLLLLQFLRVLNWWIVGLIVIIFVLLELFFKTKKVHQ